MNSETILCERKIPCDDLYTNVKKKVNQNIVLTTAHKKTKFSLQDNAWPKWLIGSARTQVSRTLKYWKKSQTGHASTMKVIAYS